MSYYVWQNEKPKNKTPSEQFQNPIGNLLLMVRCENKTTEDTTI
jgi:hypothetical protein